MFRDDFEFNDEAGPSHHGGHTVAQNSNAIKQVEDPILGVEPVIQGDAPSIWLLDAEKELKKIPFFVRGKARRNTETYAASKGVKEISVDTLYEAKAHYAN